MAKEIMVRGDRLLFFLDFAELLDKLAYSAPHEPPRWCSVTLVLAVLKERFGFEPSMCNELDVYRTTNTAQIHDFLRRNRDAIAAIDLDASFALRTNVQQLLAGETPEFCLPDEQRFAQIARAIFSGELTRLDFKDLPEAGRRLHRDMIELLVGCRERKGYTIALTAERTGINAARLMRIEVGDVFPTFREFDALAAYLGFDAREESKKLFGELSPASETEVRRALEE